MKRAWLLIAGLLCSAVPPVTIAQQKSIKIEIINPNRETGLEDPAAPAPTKAKPPQAHSQAAELTQSTQDTTRLKDIAEWCSREVRDGKYTVGGAENITYLHQMVRAVIVSGKPVEPKFFQIVDEVKTSKRTVGGTRNLLREASIIQGLEAPPPYQERHRR
jgi:hypothetical protein